MTIETQVLTLFGGLAKVRIQGQIDSGSSRTLENVALSIGRRFIEINPGSDADRTSFFWVNTLFDHKISTYPVVFNCKSFDGSMLARSGIIKKLVFRSIRTWGELNQKRVVSAITLKQPGNSIVSSISANLEVGRKGDLYIKKEQDEGKAKFSLDTQYWKSSEMRVRTLGFIPSEQAIDAARRRAETLRERPNNSS